MELVSPHLGHQVLLVGADERVGLGAAQLALGEVGVHLVSVEVGVVGLAVGVVEPQHLLPGQDARRVGLDGRPVQRGLTVQQQHVAVLDVPVYLSGREKM